MPGSDSRTVYYLNHNSWWDGIIPLLLNEYLLKQHARAIMEDKQMKQYSFFRMIGAFSIDRDDPRKAITSLRYAVQSMKRERASLFIYPEGKITPAGSPLKFEGGLAWLRSKIPEADFVPIGIYIHTIRHDKPELHLHIGTPVNAGQNLSSKELTVIYEDELNNILDELKATAGFDDTPYKQFL
jgi:1-acyl-sn-glycerol-3-phosphate acyltransferase